MKTLAAAFVTLAALNANAFSQVDQMTCTGGSTQLPGSALIKVVTHPTKDTLTLYYSQAVVRAPFINNQVLAITDSQLGAQEKIMATDSRPTDGASTKIELDVQIEEFAPTKTHPGTLTLEQFPLQGPAVKTVHNVTCVLK